MSYKCNLCNKDFRQKKDLTDHKKRKSPCISLEAMQQNSNNAITGLLQLETRDEIVREGQRSLNKNRIINIFKACLNILRDGEGLTGEKALRNLSYLLTLKLIEPQIGTQIDIDNYEFKTIIKNTPDEDDTEEELSNKQIRLNLFQQLIPLVRYSNLKNVADTDLENSIKKLWDDILAEHPSTKNIFLKDKKFDIKNKLTFRDLFKKLDEIDISNNDFDILGASYEEVIKDIMVGRVLGQYFTQPLIKRLMVELLNPQLREDGTFDTIADPTMGTGGFLISYLNEMIKQSKALNIPLDTEFIKSTIYGKEIEPDTYQLAVSNMLISSGLMLDALECGDSIRKPITRKFDNILANPPFGIKGLKYNGFDFIGKDEYIPIKSDNAVSLFIQAIINMLKIEGKCAIVLPDGQDLFSKSNTALVAIREYLLKTCDVKEIIYMPNNSFTNTGVKTCVCFFIKKKEGTEAITINSKKAKGTNRELKREYIFNKEHSTESIKFYNSEVVKVYGENKLEKTLLIEVPISDIAKNSYSLNYAEYMEGAIIEYNNEIEIKLLGEICNFQNGYAFKSDKYEEQNENTIGIVQIKSIQNNIVDEKKITEYIKENNKYKLFEIQKGDILIGLTGTFKIGIYNLLSKSYLNQRVCKIIIKSDINKMYIYYWYIYFDIELQIEQMAKGTAQANISTTDIENIKIPIPSLGRQNEIVEYLDFIHKSIDSSNQKIAELKQLNAYYLNNQTRFGKNEIKKLGEVCKMAIKGNTNSKQISNTGEYPFYKASVSNPSGTHNTYCFNGEEYLLFVKSGGNSSNPLSLSHGIGKIYLVHGKSSANTEVVQLVNNEQILLKYLYYYLKNEQLNIQKLAKYCTNLGHIDMNQFKDLNIPIPPLDQQTKIVHYCEQNDLLIAQLENTIESNKTAAKEFLTMVISSSVEAVNAAEAMVDVAATETVSTTEAINTTEAANTAEN
uniref:site-specific DNA-methyltransferase (adenine-specific) n=1 Tax=viral metagenome TaxID=1070528 RepID=A0A6C0I2C6_9ZZZZ